ncbi:hypothetical protein [Kluyvera georgiana]|uniref:hypothetical protein n=1 Tax=Kluyvera georgiana TaxID=73098 RepID=UPI0008071B90|nr:hypothetical protein [Kluyvera georgiana]MDA8493361.1 hypothetical protein [Kluyvera georgiana]
MGENTSSSADKNVSWYRYLDMSFLGCLLAPGLEIVFYDEIFIPDGGGASFGLIVLLVINTVIGPIVIVLMALISAIIPLQRKRVNCFLMCILACALAILGLFIAYPMGR